MLFLLSFILSTLHSFVLADFIWTGRADVDFLRDDFDETTGRARNFGVFYIADSIPPEGVYDPSTDFAVLPDVGVPPQLRNDQGVMPISGWDIKRVFFQYNDLEDSLNIGIDCFGICGDADGDGNEGAASPELTSIGGQDLPNLARYEGFALIIDFDLNVADVLPSFVPDINVPFDFVIGIPAGQPAGALANADPNDPSQVPMLECTRGGQMQNELLNMVDCFGVYEYQETTEVNIASRFLRRVQLNGQPWPVTNHNPLVSSARPDLEWTIDAINELRALKGASFVVSRKEPWTLLMQGFAGSFVDDGIGEDFLPSQTNYVEVNFPCLEFDVCGVCLGRGLCLPCSGIPNGPDVGYDECDVCGGHSDTCLDCAGIPNGPNVYDECDVCGGNSDTCLDCAGIPNGPGVYDVCDICNGDGSTCLDPCGGVPFSTVEVDACDVCGGDGTSCKDCAGIPNGPHSIDSACSRCTDAIDSDKCDAHCSDWQKQAVSNESDSFLCAELTLTSYKKRSGIRAEAVCNICSASDEFCCHGTCCPHGTHCCYNEYYGGARCCPSDQPRCTVNGCAANSRKQCGGTGRPVTHTCRQDEECCSFTNILIPSGVETHCCHETEQCVLPISNSYGGPVCPWPERKCGCVRKPTPSPTDPPSMSPSMSPSMPPSIAPSPTDPPSMSPSMSPSIAPSTSSSIAPSTSPSIQPTTISSIAPLPAPSIAFTFPLPFSELSALFDQVEKRTKRGRVTNCDYSPASSFDEMTHNRTRIAIKSMDALETDVGKLKRIAKGIESVIKGREESSIEVKNANQKLELVQSVIVFYERVMIHRKEYKCI